MKQLSSRTGHSSWADVCRPWTVQRHDRIVCRHEDDVYAPVDFLIAGEHELVALHEESECGGDYLESQRAANTSVTSRAEWRILKRRRLR